MIDKWLVVLAVDDLKSIPSDFQILDVTFHRFVNSDSNSWTFFNTKQGAKILSHFLNKTCALAEVDADTEDNAFEEGNKKVEIALNALRAYNSDFELRRPLNGLIKNLTTRKEGVRLEASWHRDRCSPWNYSLTKNELKKLSQSVAPLQKLISLTPTIMTKRILRALRWTAMSTQETDKADKILKYTTALECLFIKERGRKAKRVAERVAIFWNSVYSTSNKDGIYRDIHRLYKIRNKIVHGESFTVTKNDENTMDHVARNLVFAVAQEVEKNSLTTIDALLNWINSKKGSWVPPAV